MLFDADSLNGSTYFPEETDHLQGWIDLAIMGLQPYDIIESIVFKIFELIRFFKICKKRI